MREILFRGKDKDDHKWYTGTYFPYTITTFCYAEDYAAHPNNTKHYIVFDRMTDWGLPNQHLRAEAIPETIGQYTGLKDKNGKRIFEGDVVRIGSGIFEFTGCVVFEQGCFQLVDPECDVYECLWYQSEEMTVLGNIHDNPELLEAEG